jgi:glutathione S-transferase
MKTRYTGASSMIAGAARGGAQGLHAQIMSDEFDALGATEKAGIEGALNRCRHLAAQIESELRNKRPEHFGDKLSLADFYASLEHAADVLGQQSPSQSRTHLLARGSVRRRGTISEN